MPDPFFNICTNSRSFELSFHDNEAFEDFTEREPQSAEPIEPTRQPRTASEPLRLMVVFQAYNAWFFFVNGHGNNPVFDNWQDANDCLAHCWSVCKGHVIPWGPSQRKTVAMEGFQQCAIVNIPPMMPKG